MVFSGAGRNCAGGIYRYSMIARDVWGVNEIGAYRAGLRNTVAICRSRCPVTKPVTAARENSLSAGITGPHR